MIMTRLTTLLAGLCLTASTALAYAEPGACSGICNNSHDPGIIRREDGTYFRFSTGGKIAIHTAPAIEGPWEYNGALLPDGSSIDLPGNQDLWAPDVVFHDGLYYVYYSVSTFGQPNSAIGVATSTDMESGTWTDLGATGVQSDGSTPYNAIDAAVFSDGGAWRMYFGSWWDGLFTVAMSDPPTQLAEGSEAAVNLITEPVTTAVEAPFMFQQGSFYYMLYSQGLCCGYDQERPAAGEEYKILACRSESAEGPFVDSNGESCLTGGGTVVLESNGWVYGPGGEGVYNDPELGPILYYHYVDTRIGYGDGDKKFGWNTIDFSSGWPVV